ncbi:MAG TPA: xanthine dehydrogenase family protein molybdopterin-binding subunit [Gammaproteobacteria bacterium]|nr:xanthine dehydrogenase family protein molybdopterin-binding subunit [Gammaproteobacteria bacterium]
MRRHDHSRRAFLRQVAVAGVLGSTGLVIALRLPDSGRNVVARVDGCADFRPNAFVRVAPDDSVTIIVHKSEMGQGVYTSLPMIVADEMEADWEKVRVEVAPAAPAYYHTRWGPFQGTGASSSINSTWDQLREAGALARYLLVAAAADIWDVDVTACRAERGHVVHHQDGRRLSFGQLCAHAATLEPPDEIPLKAAEDYRLIGRSVKRLDTPEKVDGRACYGLDVVLPGMCTALIARPPAFGARAQQVETRGAYAVEGVRRVVSVSSGIAVVADSFQAARLGREALEVHWRPAPAPVSSDALRQAYAALAETPGRVAHEGGTPEQAMQAAHTRLGAVYELPYLAHAAMEPLNCVAHVQKDRCDIWTGSQLQTSDQDAAAEVTGLPVDAIHIHTQFLGGSFGRRANPHADFVREAVELARILETPVKVVWTREDDMRGGYYRPMHYSRIEAGLDKQGMPQAWQHRLIGESIGKGTPFEKALFHNGIDHLSVEGAVDHPYAIPHQRVDHHRTDNGVPVLWWRSVGHSFTAFVVESFIDEIAHAGGHDPVALRLELLRDRPRHRAVLSLAAEKAGWGTPLPAGIGRGIAIHKSFRSIVAQVAEVSLLADGRPRVHRVVCVIDCGAVINPDTVVAQMESGIAFGLSAALYGEITLEVGRVRQSNFHDYPVLRMSDMPEVEVHIVESGAELGGVGEVATPPIAPAVCNALFTITGKRVRRLPVGRITT